MSSINEIVETMTKSFAHSCYAEKYRGMMQNLDDLHAQQISDIMQLAWENNEVAANSVKEQHGSVEEFDILWRDYVRNSNYLSGRDRSEAHVKRSCVQLPLTHSGLEVEFFLRKGVRCFLIDLFIGSAEYNQEILVLLRSIEMKLSREKGTNVRSTVVARIHPRTQYTGMLFSEQTLCSLHVGRPIILTCDRTYSNYSNASYIYVNATHILPKLKMFDNVYIGDAIKLVVMLVDQREVECRVVHGGLLTSRMVATFPKHLESEELSWEEMEDIVFCKEMGIDYMFTYGFGQISLLREMKETMTQLELTHIKLGACLSINGFTGMTPDYIWMADNYDAFLLYIDQLAATQIGPQLLDIALPMRVFLHRNYLKNKPLIFDSFEIAIRNYIVHPRLCYFIYYLPDRYLINRANLGRVTYFQQLQMMTFKPLPARYLLKARMHGKPPSKELGLARNITQTSLDTKALLILLAFKDKLMVQKISQTRPKAQIVSVLPETAQIEGFSLNWNITNLAYKMPENESFNRNIYEKLLFGMTYALKCKLVKTNCSIVVAFEREVAVKGDFKYELHTLKFNDKLYPQQLLKLMFNKDCITPLEKE